jgi:VWFA-related protein
MIVLDDLHTSFTRTPRVKQALRTFIEESFGANDLAAVVHTSGRGDAGQEFTNNPRLLLAAIDRFSGRNLRSEALEVADAIVRRSNIPTGDDSQDNFLRGLPMDPLEFERAQNARNTLTAVKNLAEFMEGIRGRRKTMLLVSEGISYNIYDVFANSSANLIIREASEAAAAASRSNVAIYAIDPRGLAGFEQAMDAPAVPIDISPSQFSVNSALRDARRASQDSLRTLAEETGGFAAINSNDFAGAFDRIVRENSAYYVLGYYPSDDRRDGRFRRLEVRVTRPGLQVRARRGYVAPRGRAPEPAPAVVAEDGEPLSAASINALNSPIPISDVPLRLFAAAYKGTAPDASVALALEMRVDRFDFEERDGVFHDRIEVAFSAIDAEGATHGGSTHVLSLSLRPETLAISRERGVRVVSEIVLPPGRYQLRGVVTDGGGGRSGSVLYDLEVPDFYGEGLSMSGVSLTVAAERAVPTVMGKDPLANVLPGPPVATREFGREDVLALFTEFYENMPDAPPHVVDLGTTVRGADGRIVFEQSEERSSTDLQGASGGYGYSLQIPLRDMTPGTYVIRVEGNSRGDVDAVVGRDLLISVR